MPKRVALSKYLAREYSLASFENWYLGEMVQLNAFLQRDLKNILFLNEGNTRKLTAWYNDSDLEKSSACIQKKLAQPGWFEDVKKEFLHYWKQILPYDSREKPLDSWKDVHHHADLWVQYWRSMSVIFLAMDIPGVSKKIKDECYRLRAQTQLYSDAGDQIYIDFLRSHYPQVQGLEYVL